MRRAVSSFMVVSGLVGLLSSMGGVASAAPTPAPSGDAANVATPGKKQCTIKDDRLKELSGIITTRNGYLVINDSSDDDSRKKIFFLDKTCKVVKAVDYSGGGPADTEDLAISPDGKTLWIADTGDNTWSAQHRTRIALWTMPVTGVSRPVLHRVAYPDGKPRDAEALLIGNDGNPLIITKNAPTAEIYTPDGALQDNNDTPVRLRKVGELTLPRTATVNPVGAIGRVVVTGAARSPDGKKVLLRTYADAFEFDVAGGDVAKALTSTKPRITPLADPFGEAIAYTPDGAEYVTVSDVGSLAAKVEVAILAYAPKSVPPATAPAGEAKKGADGPSWFSKLSLDQITYLVAAVGGLGVLLIVIGMVGIVRGRKRAALAAEAERRNGRGKGDPSTGGAGRGGAYDDPERSGAVYGAGSGYGNGPEPARARSGGTYGGRSGAGYDDPQRSGAVYGGGRGGHDDPDRSGGVYGGGRGGYDDPDRSGGVYGGGRSAGGGRGGRGGDQGDYGQGGRRGGQGTGYPGGSRGGQPRNGYRAYGNDDSWAGQGYRAGERYQGYQQD